jgi:hypothetical protein
MRWISSFLTVILLTFLFTITALAQQETTISVSPAIVDLPLQKGQSGNAMITIRNGGEFALPISATVQSLFQEDEIISKNDKKASDASDWIKLSDNEFLLAEKEVKKLPITINVPETATSGGHYAQIAIRGLSLERSFESGTSIVLPEVVVTVLITIAGDTTTAVDISKKRILPLFVTPSTDYIARFTVANNGNIHDLLTPVFVVKKNGDEIYRQILTSKISLPNSEKVFNETLQLPDDYGVYQTFIEIMYANGHKITTSPTETVVITPPLVLILIVGLLTVLVLYVYHHRQFIGLAMKVLVSKNT